MEVIEVFFLEQVFEVIDVIALGAVEAIVEAFDCSDQNAEVQDQYLCQSILKLFWMRNAECATNENPTLEEHLCLRATQVEFFETIDCLHLASMWEESGLSLSERCPSTFVLMFQSCVVPSGPKDN